jgi:hypothetical protein
MWQRRIRGKCEENNVIEEEKNNRERNDGEIQELERWC